MTIRWTHAGAITGLITAFAMSAHASDWTLKAQGVNPLYPAVSGQVQYAAGTVDTAQDDHALNAADRNPFYAGVGRAESATYSGGGEVTIADASLKNAEVNPLY